MAIARTRKRCEARKGIDKRIDESVIRRFVHIGRMGNDRVAIKVYGESVWELAR